MWLFVTMKNLTFSNLANLLPHRGSVSMIAVERNSSRPIDLLAILLNNRVDDFSMCRGHPPSPATVAKFAAIAFVALSIVATC